MKKFLNNFKRALSDHIQLMRLALAAMRACGNGLIINVTSLASRLPVPFMAAYKAAKAAMASFTMSIQLELPDPNIRIVDLQPADICIAFNYAISRSDGNEHAKKDGDCSLADGVRLMAADRKVWAVDIGEVW